MYGENGYTLIKELARSEDNLPPYNVSKGKFNLKCNTR